MARISFSGNANIPKKGLSVLDALKNKSREVKWNMEDRKEHFVIFSKSGFTDELLEYAENNHNVYLRADT